MKPFRRFNTIFYKLIFSYSILTVLITAILGFTSYVYSSKAINGQIVDLHQKMLAYLKNEINITVLKKVDSLYIDLSVGKYSNDDIIYLWDNPASRDYSRISSAYQFLKGLANTNSDIIDSIYLYFPGQNMILSSSYGVKFLDDASRDSITKTDWFKSISGYSGSTMWIGTRKVPEIAGITTHSDDILTYIHSYPYTQAPGAYKGFIVINVKESALAKCIQDIAPEEYKDIYVLGPDGHVICACKSSFLYADLHAEPYVQHILASSLVDESALQKANGEESMVSFTSLPPTSWKLVDVTSVHDFYRQSIFFQRILIILCISVIVLGLIISTLFTSYMYNPWKSLINRIKNMFKPSAQFVSGRNPEVDLINEIVNELSIKVSALQSTLETNRPLIKHNLVTSLLSGRILTRERYEENIRLIPDLSICQPYFSALLIEFDPALIAGMSMENKVFLKYNTIKDIEDFSNDACQYLAAEYSDGIIGAIACASEQDHGPSDRMLNHIMDCVFSNFKIEVTALSGKWVNDILAVHDSFNECLGLLKYRFFLPGTRLLAAEHLALREASRDALPDSILDCFSKGLNNRDIDLVIHAAGSFAEAAQSGKYSAEQCGEHLQSLLLLLGNYIKNMRCQPEETGRTDLLYVRQTVRDVEAFKAWIAKICAVLFRSIELRANSKNTELVEYIKQYVDANLHKDISLDILAEKTHLSAHYISKLFKEETCINLIDYITLQRIERAKRLLAGTSLPIKEIASKVGYNNPAYFIKKFRDSTGDTPLNYKRSIQK